MIWLLNWWWETTLAAPKQSGAGAALRTSAVFGITYGRYRFVATPTFSPYTRINSERLTRRLGKVVA